MASIIDVAKRAGVSISTVSRVINDFPNVSSEKRKAVCKAITDLNYVPNALAQGLVKKATYSIAVLVADITNLFYANLVKIIERKLNDKGYYTIIGNIEWNPEKEREYIQCMIQKQVDGIILASTTLKDKELQRITTRGIPIVVIDKEVNIDGIDLIRTDNFKGGYLATEHLIEVGYKRLVHISGPLQNPSVEERKKGFLKCIREYRILDKKYKIITGDDIEECVRNMDEYLGQYKIEEPVGVFAANDIIAFGILKVLDERKIRCPESVGVVGFDETIYTKYSNPSLTTIKSPVKEVGRLVIDTLIYRLENQKEEHFQRNVNLDVRLVERESTRLKGTVS